MIAGPAGSMLNRTVGRANFDFTPTASNQLTLRKGAMITVVQKGEPGGWSKGMDEQGKTISTLAPIEVFNTNVFKNLYRTYLLGY